jgi:hypothetical protein
MLDCEPPLPDVFTLTVLTSKLGEADAAGTAAWQNAPTPAHEIASTAMLADKKRFILDVDFMTR